MSYIIVGLGNPGQEYENTRHNTGMIVLDNIFDVKDWKNSKPHNALLLKSKIGKNSVICLKPQTFMNKSGESLKTITWNENKAKKLIVIHDELDLGLGTFKISFNRGSGGHRGVESIKKSIKTEGFIRIRVGISPVVGNKVKKPDGSKVESVILGEFKPSERKSIDKISKEIEKALDLIVQGELFLAMSTYNAR